MTPRNLLPFICLALLLPALGGCVRAAKDTTGFAVESTASVDAPMDEVWQATKSVLREQELEIYTRDKRGTFVAYTPMKRRLFQPQRIQYTIELTPVNRYETKVYVEAVKQLYGVTTFTYPGWYDRPIKDAVAAETLLTALQTKLSAPTSDGSTTTEEATAVETPPAPDAAVQ
ncbi:MAG: hypothetical protein HYV27_23505 [Candidatus Hydrogenedentes bacterium]|nr:hypothetical protein [Candidatus Hydrogenedentota bacterium]